MGHSTWNIWNYISVVHNCTVCGTRHTVWDYRDTVWNYRDTVWNYRDTVWNYTYSVHSKQVHCMWYMYVHRTMYYAPLLYMYVVHGTHVCGPM